MWFNGIFVSQKDLQTKTLDTCLKLKDFFFITIFYH